MQVRNYGDLNLDTGDNIDLKSGRSCQTHEKNYFCCPMKPSEQ